MYIARTSDGARSGKQDNVFWRHQLNLDTLQIDTADEEDKDEDKSDKQLVETGRLRVWQSKVWRLGELRRDEHRQRKRRRHTSHPRNPHKWVRRSRLWRWAQRKRGGRNPSCGGGCTMAQKTPREAQETVAINPCRQSGTCRAYEWHVQAALL